MSAIPVKEKKTHGDMKYNYHAIVQGMITGNGAMLPGMEEGGWGGGGVRFPSIKEKTVI